MRYQHFSKPLVLFLWLFVFLGSLNAQEWAYIDCHGGYNKVKIGSQPGPVLEKKPLTIKCGQKIQILERGTDESKIDYHGHSGYVSTYFLSETLSQSVGVKSRRAGEQQFHLPADYGIDLKLAIANRPSYMRSFSEIVDGPLNSVGTSVFYKLVDAGFNAPYPWKLTLVNNEVVNAASSAGGQVYVYGGLLKLLGTNSGLWAAVLSHEVSHTGLRHQVRVYLLEQYDNRMIAYYRLRVANGDNSAGYALAAFSISAAIALKKIERNQEHEADESGMLLMARAGFHPDYVFALHHMLRIATGEQSKFAAFFSSHPRWETRDQRSQREYSESLAEFNRLWPDPTSSPGGIPPAVAFLGEPIVQEEKNWGALIHVPVHCRNASTPVTVMARFFDGEKPAQGFDAEYKDTSGNFVANQQFACSESDSLPAATIKVPSPPNGNRKLKAQVFVVDGDEMLERSQLFDVHFPKRK